MEDPEGKTPRPLPLSLTFKIYGPVGEKKRRRTSPCEPGRTDVGRVPRLPLPVRLPGVPLQVDDEGRPPALIESTRPIRTRWDVVPVRSRTIRVRAPTRPRPRVVSDGCLRLRGRPLALRSVPVPLVTSPAHAAADVVLPPPATDTDVDAEGVPVHGGPRVFRGRGLPPGAPARAPGLRLEKTPDSRVGVGRSILPAPLVCRNESVSRVELGRDR